MKPTAQTFRLPAALTLALSLAACGGGGSDSPPPQPPVNPTCNGFEIVADANVTSGKTAGASAISCGAPLRSITWSQVSGPVVNLAAARTPTVAVETDTTGTIALRAVAVLDNGSTVTKDTSIVVAPALATSFLTLRVDHSVRPETDTSIRAWPVMVNGETVTRIVWTQVGGPSVTMNTTDESVLMFTAPTLAATPRDVVLKFRATMTTSAGRTDFDEVNVSIDRQSATPDGFIFERTARVHPYRAVSAYAGVLAECAYDVRLFYQSSVVNNLCSVNKLPLLQAEAGTGNVPSVEQVMGRVLVSHDFLGANFEQFLRTQDPNSDFRRLLGGVTAIVLGSHVRPSFYTAGTGAIYLDAGNLWLTATERDVVTEVPDYRSEFDDLLNFTGVGRLVKDNDYARPFYAVDERVSRTQEQLVFVLGRLMYHELGHAGDFFSPADRNLDGNKGIFLNVVNRLQNETLPSDVLAQQFPLTSSQMKRLGQVMYLGETPTAAERAYTPTQVGEFFSSDFANDDYAYSTSNDVNSREDLAMLFEEFMMYHRHGAQADVAYTNLYRPDLPSEQLLVAWGQRGRIGHPLIKPRIKLVLSKIAPWIPASAVDALPAPIQLVVGDSWEENLDLRTRMMPSKPQAASFMTGLTAEKAGRAREDMANRRHAH